MEEFTENKMIDKIKIEGYKSIKSAELQLRPINILIGSNAAGKSNFISFFKLLNVLYEKQLQNYSLKSGIDNLLYFGRKNTKNIYGKIFFKPHEYEESNNQYLFELGSTADETLFIEKEKSGYFAEWTNDKRDYITVSDFKESWIKNSDTYRNSYLQEYLSSFKVYHFHDTSIQAPLRRPCRIDDNIYFKEDGSNLPAFLYFLKEKHKKSFKRIEKIVKSIVPYFDTFQLRPDRINEDLIKLEWREINYPNNYFNAQNLSDGSLRFIALTILLLQPKLPSTIIIDEPELGLHPVAINKLAGLLKSATNRGSQIIVSTQSVNLLNNFDIEDIITVDKINNESVFRRLNGSELKTWIKTYSLGELWLKNVINGQP